MVRFVKVWSQWTVGYGPDCEHSVKNAPLLLGNYVGMVVNLFPSTTTKPNQVSIMAKALTKSQIAAEIAAKNNLTKKQAAEIIESIVQLAYKHAKNSFTLPGLGKLVLVNRKARKGRNPATGETIQIKAKRVVKFRVAKAAKDAILGTK
jgi:DNA-binding protein HU-beta